MPEDEKVMICVDADGSTVPVEGSMVVQCKQCAKPVWISQESLMAYPDAQAICLPCAMPGISREDAEFPQIEDQPEVAVIVAALRNGWRP